MCMGGGEGKPFLFTRLPLGRVPVFMRIGTFHWQTGYYARFWLAKIKELGMVHMPFPSLN